MLTSTLFLGLLVGSAVGLFVGFVKFRNPLLGAIVGAACGAGLSYVLSTGPDKVIAVETAKEFNSDVLKAERPVLVDFYADWCPPCRKLAPTIKSLAKEYAGRVTFVKVNVDKGRGLAQVYGVRGIPTVILFVQSHPVGRWTGCRPADHYRPALDAALAKK